MNITKSILPKNKARDIERGVIRKEKETKTNARDREKERFSQTQTEKVTERENLCYTAHVSNDHSI